MARPPTPVRRSSLFVRTMAVVLVLCGLSLEPSRLLAQSYTEEAAARGVSYSTPYGSFPAAYGSGVGLVDLDGDEDLDLVLLGSGSGTVGIFENDGSGVFTDRSSSSGIPQVLHLSGVSAADYDGDDDLDLYITHWIGANLLLRNEGNFTFTSIGGAAGVADPGPGTGASWGDYDGDGRVDLYVVNRGGQFGAPGMSGLPNRLYRNQGDGTFVDVAPAHGVDNEFAGFQAAFFDPDRDGDADLYLSNDKGTTVSGAGNRLYRNDAGTLVDASVETGTYLEINSMGIAVGDIDQNGFLDIYVTNTDEGNALLLNQGNSTFVEGAEAAGVGGYWLGWGTHFLDVAHDGAPDLLVANWYGREFLFANNGVFPCVEIGAVSGFSESLPTLCTATGDIDSDGDIDIVVQDFMLPTRLHIHQGAVGNWIIIRLDGTSPNRAAIGATIDIRCGEKTQTQPVLSSSGYKSMSSLDLHFGLGTAATVDEIDVTWPDGTRTIRRAVTANQYFTISRDGGAFPDCNGNGVADESDIAQGTSFDENANETPDECESRFRRGDSDGSGDLDLADVVQSLQFLFSNRIALCPEALDANDDGQIDVADPIVLVLHILAGGGPLPAPGSGCGIDPTPLDPAEALGCLGAFQLCP